MNRYIHLHQSQKMLRHVFSRNHRILNTNFRNCSLKIQQDSGKDLEEALRYDVAIIGNY